MSPTDYDDAMARAHATLAALNRAAAEFSRADAAADITVGLQHLRDDLQRPDAPSMAQPARR